MMNQKEDQLLPEEQPAEAVAAPPERQLVAERPARAEPEEERSAALAV
jgi:hypothetical protein